MYAKSAIVLPAVQRSTRFVVFASSWWIAIPLAVLLGLALAVAAFNIQHDGGHAPIRITDGSTSWRR
jgi:linoleoyl-CoA desaturase